MTDIRAGRRRLTTFLEMPSRDLAKRVGVSQSTVARVWRAFNLQPHRVESFRLSNDPLFIDKVRDIVGLYMNPPTHAVVLCVDEKSQIHFEKNARITKRQAFGIKVYKKVIIILMHKSG